MNTYFRLFLVYVFLFSTNARSETDIERSQRIDSIIPKTIKIKDLEIPEEFKEECEGTIQVYVLGQVNRSGSYYLMKGSDALDALEAALGFNRLGSWRLTSIRRETDNGKIIIRFSRDNKLEDSKVKLQDGDVIVVDCLH